MKLEAENISFQYDDGNRRILNHVSLSMEHEERVGITAPSGFGKTTLCKILAGYEAPDSGSVLLDGKPLSEYKGYCPVQMVWQHPEISVNPRLRMQDVIKEGSSKESPRWNQSWKGVEERIIRGLGIEEDWMKRYPGELSGGELQRFCIARALGERTRFLLADEISTMLDLITQSQIWNFLMDEVQQRGIGLIVVSHSEELLERVCTRIVDLRL